jgi:hypothetical protein
VALVHALVKVMDVWARVVGIGKHPPKLINY